MLEIFHIVIWNNLLFFNIQLVTGDLKDAVNEYIAPLSDTLLKKIIMENSFCICKSKELQNRFLSDISFLKE